MNTAHILIVEDDAILVTRLEQTLIQSGYQVAGVAATGKAAVESALAQKPDAILMDIQLRGEMTGIQAAAEIHRQMDIPIIYLTAYTDEEMLQQAKVTDAYAFLSKPVRDRELRASLEMALYKHATERRLYHLNQVLRAVRDINQLITREHDQQKLLADACQILVRTRGYRLAWIGVPDGSGLIPPVTFAGQGWSFIEKIKETPDKSLLKRLPGMECLATKRAVTCHDMLNDDRYEPWQVEANAVQFHSTVAIPMQYDDKVFGILNVYADQSNLFDVEEVDLLVELANDLSFSLKAIEQAAERKRIEAEVVILHQAVETSGEAIFLTDLQGIITYINPAFTRLYGYTASEVVGRTTPRLLKSGRIDADHYAAFWTKIASGQIVTGEWVNKTRDGRLIDVVGSASPVVDGAGQTLGFLAIQRDITDRKQAEQAIRESEQRFRMLLQDVQSVSVQGYSMDGTTQYWNKASENLYGYTAQDAIGKNLIDLIIPPEMEDGVRQAISTMVESGQPIPASELTLMKKDSSRVTVYSSHAIVKGIGGEPELFCIDIDLSARKQAEEALSESANRLKEAQRIAKIGNWELNLVNNKLLWSDEIYRIFEIAPEKFGASYQAFLYAIHPDDRDAVNKAYTASLETRNAYEIDHRLLMPDGRVKYVHESCETFYDFKGQPIRSVGTVQDITERHIAEQAIRESEERFSTIFHASPIPVLIVRAADGKFVDINEAFQSMSGYGRDEVIGHAAPELNHWVNPDDLRRLEMNLREQGTVRDFDTKLRTKSGLIQDVLMSAATIEVSGARYVINLAYDITARRQHESELQAIASLSAALRTAPARTEMLPVILEQLVALLNWDTASVEIIDPLTGDAVTEAAKGCWEALIGNRQKSGTGINTIISQTRQPYFTNDLKNDPNLAYPEWTYNDIHGGIGAPLIAQEEHLIGFLWVGRKNEITKSDIRLLASVADMAANAIYRVTLYEQSQKDAANLILAYDSTLEGWAHALELRDQETEGHTRRVMQMTVKLAQAMGIELPALENVRRGALLHDIGKMAIPDSILLKPGTLNEREWEIMRRHPEYAYEFLERIGYLHPVIDIPYCHHEKWDGSGYPRGLKGEQIPRVARIFAIVDVWDALRSDRPYRPAWSEEKTRKYILEQSGKHFDPQGVQVFLDLL
jgi:PAS domain S-box-containing protein/putative nucleotidyltransferase with HDIG domain